MDEPLGLKRNLWASIEGKNFSIVDWSVSADCARGMVSAPGEGSVPVKMWAMFRKWRSCPSMKMQQMSRNP